MLLTYIAARALATYLIPGCVGRGVRLGSENSSAVGGVWKSGNLEIWDFGNLEIWGPGNPEILRFGDLEIQKFGIQQIKKIKSLKIQIRSAQNVGKVWISRKKIFLAPFGAIWTFFLRGPEKSKKIQKKNAYFPGVGPLLLSTRGGGIGSFVYLATLDLSEQ